MAKRKVGKYVVGKHERTLYGDTLPDNNVTLPSSSLNLKTIDATTGNLQSVTSVTGSAGSNPYIGRPAPVLLDEATYSLTKSAHSGRELVVSMSANATYTLPTATAAGEYYHFIYGGEAASALQFEINTNQATQYLHGHINHLNTTANASTTCSIAPASSRNGITGSKIEALDLHFEAESTSLWNVWGSLTGVSDSSASFYVQ